jgi:predicted acetyltransferase
MGILVPPTVALQASFLEALGEYHAEDLAFYGRLDPEQLSRPEAFAVYVRSLLLEALPGTPRPPGQVPQTTLWWVEDRRFIGRLSIRHELNEWLRTTGGHIGYDVRPSERRKGHATAMLAAALPVAHVLGIDPALVTCDHDNVGSRKVIEANGGVADQPTATKLRYWVPTSGASRP